MASDDKSGVSVNNDCNDTLELQESIFTDMSFKSIICHLFLKLLLTRES